ncbi:hypothetical protein [Chishuiella sp.]|uniref:hypothetical protein n=1 Tax=Chishuiella sp. TaxID=1969467 RepID=UPI0028AD9B40|nr:hypothetical protein [Chishuiella sp.]
MPKAKDVNPKKWTNKITLYDDNVYSVCWGNFEGSLNRTMGERWNENYPRQGNNPTWYVTYEVFQIERINNIINLLKNAKKINNNNEYSLLNIKNEKTCVTYEEIEFFLENCNKAMKEIELTNNQ